MQPPRYALVAYVREPIGDFVEKLRRELHPELPQFAAHVTILPPRPLSDTEAAAIQSLEEDCSQVEAFEVMLGEVETFIPVTPTVFIRVAHGATRMQELHDRLNHGPLICPEQWPYTPHLTIAKMTTEEQAWGAADVSRKRWRDYEGMRRIAIEELTFVREAELNSWVDLAPVRLGPSLVSRSRK